MQNGANSQPVSEPKRKDVSEVKRLPPSVLSGEVEKRAHLRELKACLPEFDRSKPKPSRTENIIRMNELLEEISFYAPADLVSSLREAIALHTDDRRSS